MTACLSAALLAYVVNGSRRVSLDVMMNVFIDIRITLNDIVMRKYTTNAEPVLSFGDFTGI